VIVLHPDLGAGPSRDPLASWQVDTDEIRDVVELYTRHLADVKEPELLSRRLGLLWKKLGSTPRLARLVWEYSELRRRQVAATTKARDPGDVRILWQILEALEALGRPPRRPEPRSRPTFIEDDPLYDPALDG
jgi:hypothetical protein